MNAADMFKFVANRLESFLNSNDQILVNVQRLKVAWAVRDGDTVKGFLLIGKRPVPFMALYNEKYGEVEIWIKGIGKVTFTRETVETFIDEIKHEEAKRA